MYIDRLKNKKKQVVLLGATLILIAIVSLLLLGKTSEKKSNPSTEADMENNAKVLPVSKAKEKCLIAAYKNFMDEWNKKCKESGINNKLPNCNLPKDMGDTLNKNWTEAKDKCAE